MMTSAQNRSEYDSILEVAITAAKDASSIIMEALDQPRRVSHKGLINLVTETDRRCEETIIAHIKDSFPRHQILAEETGRHGQESEVLWVVDPLDGTTNFVHGYPAFCVSIGVLINNQPAVGVIIELPALHTYTVIRGQGAYRDNKMIKVSDCAKLQNSLLVTGFSYEHDKAWEANMSLFKELTHLTQGVRRIGSAAIDLCHVAAGYLDGFWELSLHPWDSAAGILLVEEAGGKVTRMDGKDYTIFDKQILATNGILHDALLENTRPVVAKVF